MARHCEGRGGEYYYRAMTRDAVLVVPGRVIDRETVVESFEGTPPWDRYEIKDARVVRLPGSGGVLAYRAIATRGSQTYDAWMSTTYLRRDGAWAIAAHQQTPL